MYSMFPLSRMYKYEIYRNAWRKRNPEKMRAMRLRAYPKWKAYYALYNREHPEWHAWYNATQRCNDPSHPYYKWYGARGIKMLYKSYEDFFEDVGKKPYPELSLDRINNNGNYESGNCRWATKKQQSANQRPKQKCAIKEKL